MTTDARKPSEKPDDFGYDYLADKRQFMREYLNEPRMSKIERAMLNGEYDGCPCAELNDEEKAAFRLLSIMGYTRRNYGSGAAFLMGLATVARTDLAAPRISHD